MSQPCAIETCEQPSRVLCHCCNENFCLEHLSTHNTSTDYQTNSLTDQVNTLQDRFKKIDVPKLVENGREKLTKWRYDSLKMIDRFYDKKCEELDRYSIQRTYEQQKEIDQLYRKIKDLNQKQDADENDLQTTINNIKQKLGVIEQKGIPIDIHSLSIDKNLINIGNSKTQEFDISTLKPPYRTIDCSEKLGSALATNDQFLLVDQNSVLSLFNTDLTVLQETSWEHGTIYDICFSSGLDSFVVVTGKSKAFLVNGNNLSISSIEAMQDQYYISCTCSKSLLYLLAIGNGIVKYDLLPSICYSRRWDPPMSCKKNELIKDIACNDDTLAVIVAPHSNKMAHLVLRSLDTFDQLSSIRLDIRHPSYQLPIRCCPFKSNEWFVTDANTSHTFHVDKDGKVKGTMKYDRPPCNAIVFGSNVLVIRTDNDVNFHELLH